MDFEKSKFSSQNFFQKTNQRICFSILTLARFLEEVLAGKFVFDFYGHLSNFKVMWEMFSNFVAFPQYPNFTILWVSRPEPRDLQVTHIMCLCTTRSKTSWIRNRLYIYVILEGIKNKTLNLHLRKRFECYFKKSMDHIMFWIDTQRRWCTLTS